MGDMLNTDNIDHMGPKTKKQIVDILSENSEMPVEIGILKNVWLMSFATKAGHHVLHIIKTAAD